jgi:hypothetical protein
MNIYKVTYRVKEKKRPGCGNNSRWDQTEGETQIYIGRKGLKPARLQYREYLERLQHTFSYSVRGTDRLGTVELFIPHVHNNGLLAYWPKDDGKYIEKKEFSD